MKQLHSSRLVHCAGLLMVALLWLANSSNPPNGRTGAPFDGNCNQCHSPSSALNGDVTITGLPATIMPNVVYPLQITMDATTGSPSKGGFQLVVVDGNNANAGNLTAGNAQSGTETSGGRQYLEHRGAKAFASGSVTWDFTWTAPSSASGNTIKFYYIGNFTNGNNSDSGDHAVATSDTYTFAGAPSVLANISNTNDVTCSGGNNGSASVEPGGGVPPYTYLWSNGQTGQTAINLTANGYTVTVTASGGSGTATATAFITQPAPVIVNANVSGTLNCTQGSVNVTATTSGGIGPYTYAWSNGATGNPASYSVGGSQSVTVTDANSCIKVASFVIQGNSNPPTATAGNSATITCIQPTAMLSGTGSSTGSTIAYFWTASNGGHIVSGANTLIPTVNAAGTYTLVVTDNASGCTDAATTTVTSSIAPPNASATGGTLTCSQSSVTINATSTTTTGATFTWVGPNGFTSNQQIATVTVAGTYTLTVTNPANGCTSTGTAIVTQSTTSPTVSVTSNSSLSCTNTSVAITTTTNATNPTFLWSGPNGFTAATQNINVQVPGNYTVTVASSSNGCTATAIASVVQNIIPPTATALPSGPLTCTDTSVLITTTTNASSATFHWAGPGGFNAVTQNISIKIPGNYTVTVTSPLNGCTATTTAIVVQNIAPPIVSIATPGILNCNNLTLQLNASASSQGNNFIYQWTTANGNIVAGGSTLTPTVNAAGTYNLLITNSQNGCTANAGVVIIQTPAVSATIASSIQVSCNGGTNGLATVNATGGTGNYTYLWTTGATTATTNNLSAGTYMVTVTSSNTCTATAVVTISQPALLAANASATAQTANGINDGTATAAPSGGTGNYTYIWSNSATTAHITGLAPGNYIVTVTDTHGCTAIQTVTVNSINCNLSAVVTGNQVTCHGAANGSATVNLTGAALPATYIWTNGAVTASINGLTPGGYTVSIIDANGCPAVGSAMITEPATLLANATATAITAVNANDGQAIAQPNGGTIPYHYLWNTGSTVNALTGLLPGNYTVTVSDNNACTAVQTVTVNAFNCTLLTTITATPTTCSEIATGSATVGVGGGSAPYSYVWNNGSTLATLNNLAAGSYLVTVTDAAGCFSLATAAVVLLDTIAPALACPENISLCGADLVSYPLPIITDNCSLVSALPTLMSGQASGTAFDDGVTMQVFSATDAAGNTSICSFTVTVFPPPDILIDSTHNDIDNSGIGSIYVTAVGGVGPYTFTWRKDFVFFSNEEDLTGLQAGSYMLAITDANGCETLLAPVIVDNIVATNAPSSRSSVKVWPNPVQTGIWVKMNELEVFSAEVLNTQGELVQSLKLADLTDFLSVEYLPNGIYYLKILDTAGKTWVAKWVKGN